LHEVAGHFHDTYGQALANVLASLQMGVHVFDTSIAGLGGCPFAVGATGNVATEDVAYLMRGMGIDCGLDFDALVDVGRFISDRLGRRVSRWPARGWLAQRARQAALQA
jgi:hydroxymethylglutaryl-CoA lyase